MSINKKTMISHATATVLGIVIGYSGYVYFVTGPQPPINGNCYTVSVVGGILKCDATNPGLFGLCWPPAEPGECP